jgi:hypothetical protein
MNIISGSTNNIFYTKGYNFDDRVSIDPETGLANLMVNGDAEFGSTYNISSQGISRTGSYDGSYCFYDIGNRGYLGTTYTFILCKIDGVSFESNVCWITII